MTDQTATEATELDKSRRYLRPVRATIISDDPDGVHLAVYEWLPMFEAWATGPGLCGESMRQGPLPDDTEVTCKNCLSYQPIYQVALDRQATRAPRPSAQELLLAQVQAAVKNSGLKQTWMAQRLVVSEKHLSQMLTGRVEMTLDWAERILALCGLELDVTARPTAGGVR
jgi:hypothetical protein